MHTLKIRIYYRDTDCGGVVYYANYLDYFERARTHYFEDNGVNVTQLKDSGIQFIVKNAELEYISPSRYGETIVINTSVDNVKGASIDFSYVITEEQSRRKIVIGTTKLVCIGNDLKPRRLPREILTRIKE